MCKSAANVTNFDCQDTLLFCELSPMMVRVALVCENYDGLQIAPSQTSLVLSPVVASHIVLADEGEVDSQPIKATSLKQ